jgi:hypothetical protein
LLEVNPVNPENPVILSKKNPVKKKSCQVKKKDWLSAPVYNGEPAFAASV